MLNIRYQLFSLSAKLHTVDGIYLEKTDERVTMLKKISIALVGLVMANAAVAADVEAGKAKAAVCVACHGVNGISAVDIYPNLAGQKAAYVVKQLKAFRSGARNEPQMTPFVMALTDEEMENLAAYYASLK